MDRSAPHNSNDRTERYTRRLDEHLATFKSDAARRVFLASESRKWVERYTTWAARIDRGLEPDSDATAFDYLNTLCEIDLRLNRLGGEPTTGAVAAREGTRSIIDLISQRASNENTQTTWSA